MMSKELKRRGSGAGPGGPRAANKRSEGTSEQKSEQDQEIPAQLPAAEGAVVSRRAADRLRAGHVWVYRSDVMKVSSEAGLTPVLDARGIPLGTALYSPTSEIALRLVSTELLADEAEWLDLLGTRLRASIAQRSEILASPDSDACRLVFSEADALPGIIVDKYGELVILQLLAKAVDNEAVRIVVTKILREVLDPATIVERPDARIRELEQLAVPLDGAPLYARDGEPLLKTIFRLNGLKFHYDASAGQKTGAFLDQRENYAAAGRYAHGEALDVCTYQGGFALHLAQSCPRVTGIDVSRAALEVAEQNLLANGDALRDSEVDWVEANAFDLLRDWSDSGAAYDTIVLDPPAFAKSKRAVEGAVRGYKELNLRALKMLRPGGILVTCSCSHHVSLEDFTAVVAAAAGDAGRRVRLLERRGAAADHPVVLTIPETEYLKCLICVVE
jgi:23S rRNA (cytosine1962-C5)-methyltransferase